MIAYAARYRVDLAVSVLGVTSRVHRLIDYLQNEHLLVYMYMLVSPASTAVATVL